MKKAFKLDNGTVVDLVDYVNNIMRTKDITAEINNGDSFESSFFLYIFLVYILFCAIFILYTINI